MTELEKQERANALAFGISYDEYKRRQGQQDAWYKANRRKIDAQIRRDDAELDTGDGDQD
jgi:hypothetical protein